MEATELMEAEEKAAKSLQAARSGDLEEEDEGHELMKCHRFTSKHPHHQLTFALANEFAFPDPEASHKAVLNILDLVLNMPCQLAIETGRDLAQRLRQSGKAELAREAFLKAASVTMLLDGKNSVDEVLNDWGETRTRPATVPKPVKTGDMESLVPEEETTWLQRQRKAAAKSTVKFKKVPTPAPMAPSSVSPPKPSLEQVESQKLDVCPDEKLEQMSCWGTCTMLLVPTLAVFVVAILLRRPWAKT